MSEEVNNPYGYGDDTPSQASLIAQFGLNAGKAKLVKFEWINNGGKDGAEAESSNGCLPFIVEEEVIVYWSY